MKSQKATIPHKKAAVAITLLVLSILSGVMLRHHYYQELRNGQHLRDSNSENQPRAIVEPKITLIRQFSPKYAIADLKVHSQKCIILHAQELKYSIVALDDEQQQRDVNIFFASQVSEVESYSKFDIIDAETYVFSNSNRVLFWNSRLNVPLRRIITLNPRSFNRNRIFSSTYFLSGETDISSFDLHSKPSLKYRHKRPLSSFFVDKSSDRVLLIEENGTVGITDFETSKSSIIGGFRLKMPISEQKVFFDGKAIVGCIDCVLLIASDGSCKLLLDSVNEILAVYYNPSTQSSCFVELTDDMSLRAYYAGPAGDSPRASSKLSVGKSVKCAGFEFDSLTQSATLALATFDNSLLIYSIHFAIK